MLSFTQIFFFLIETNNNYISLEKIHFIKYSGKCKTSIIFSTNGKNIYKMLISIIIYLSSLHREFSYMHYTFIAGFNQENYFFYEYANYGLIARVLYSERPLSLPIAIGNATLVRSYFRSLSINKSDICIITENKHQAIIHPDYNEYINDGYIIGIKAVFYDNGKLFETHDYNEFECNTDETYRDSKTVFISDKYPKLLLYFIAIYVKADEFSLNLKEIKFSVFINKIYHINNSTYFPTNINSFFDEKKSTIYRFLKQYLYSIQKNR